MRHVLFNVTGARFTNTLEFILRDTFLKIVPSAFPACAVIQKGRSHLASDGRLKCARLFPTVRQIQPTSNSVRPIYRNCAAVGILSKNLSRKLGRERTRGLNHHVSHCGYPLCQTRRIDRKTAVTMTTNVHHRHYTPSPSTNDICCKILVVLVQEKREVVNYQAAILPPGKPLHQQFKDIWPAALVQLLYRDVCINI